MTPENILPRSETRGKQLEDTARGAQVLQHPDTQLAAARASASAAPCAATLGQRCARHAAHKSWLSKPVAAGNVALPALADSTPYADEMPRRRWLHSIRAIPPAAAGAVPVDRATVVRRQSLRRSG